MAGEYIGAQNGGIGESNDQNIYIAKSSKGGKGSDLKV